jgi:hypothetical protein
MSSSWSQFCPTGLDPVVLPKRRHRDRNVRNEKVCTRQSLLKGRILAEKKEEFGIGARFKNSSSPVDWISVTQDGQADVALDQPTTHR